MANKDIPRGFEPVGKVRQSIELTAGGRIFPGDCVHFEADGKVDAAAANEAIAGVALSYADADGDPVLVCTDPNQLYRVQADEDDIDAQTDINLNYDILATAGDTTYKQSRQELDSDSGNTTATLQLKLLKVEARPDNALGAQVDCIVKINNHQMGEHTGTAGL